MLRGAVLQNSLKDVENFILFQFRGWVVVKKGEIFCFWLQNYALFARILKLGKRVFTFLHSKIENLKQIHLEN